MPIIKMPHKKCDYTCMWNGIEDLYEYATGVRSPNYLFFALSGFCDFTYIRQKNAPVKRMAYWNNALTSRMYDFMEDIIGFEYGKREGLQFNTAFSAVKKSVDNGVPVVIGAADMYYLPYYKKFYRNFHIPIHYILLVGYDDNKRLVYAHDCGMESLATIDYENFQKAWNVHLPGYSKPNTFYTIRFNKNISCPESILKAGLVKKARQNCSPPVSVFGIPALRKFGKDIACWKDELSARDYRAAVLHAIEYANFPPYLPPELFSANGAHLEKLLKNFQGSRNVFADSLSLYAALFSIDELHNTAAYFRKSGSVIKTVIALLVRQITNNDSSICDIAGLLENIASLEEQGFHSILRLFDVENTKES